MDNNTSYTGDSKTEKSAAENADGQDASMTVIGGADGPTTVFTAGREKPQYTLRQRIHMRRYEARKQRVIRSLKPGTHTFDEVFDYIVNELGYTELNRSGPGYQTIYKMQRALFLVLHRPDLLGDLAKLEPPEAGDGESLRRYMKRIDEQHAFALKVPVNKFDIDLHIFVRCGLNYDTRIVIETTYGDIDAQASGRKSAIRRNGRNFRKVIRYYGVSQEDIDQKTERYNMVVEMLTV